jgi:hypothetical protein
MSTTSTTPLINLARLTRSLLTDPANFLILASLVVLGDAVFTQLIIRFVSCQRLFLYVAKMTVTNTLYRHRDRLGDLYDTYRDIFERRARLYIYHGANRASSVRIISPQFVYSSRKRPVIQQVMFWLFAFCT